MSSIYSAKYISPNFGYPKGASGRRGHGHDGSIIGIGVHVSGANFQSNYNWIMNPSANASYNALIRLDGRIISLVPEMNPAYSHGRINNPSWPLLKSGVNPNIYTLSVARTGANQNTWTTEQMESMVKLLKYWSDKYDIPLEEPYVFGHHHIDSVGRWYCPGGPFWDALLIELDKVRNDPPIPPEISPVYRVIVASNETYEESKEALDKIQKLFPSRTPEIVLNEVGENLWYRVVFEETETEQRAREVISIVKEKWSGSVWFVNEWEDLKFEVPQEDIDKPSEEEDIDKPSEEEDIDKPSEEEEEDLPEKSPEEVLEKILKLVRKVLRFFKIPY